MKQKVEETYRIETDQQEWLEAMARAHQLPDASKALRVLLDFAMEEGDPQSIFGSVRCRHCG
jgi:hypothetical protein